MPALRETSDKRTARAWSIGSAEDAVALAVAFSHAEEDATGRNGDRLQLFASGLGQRGPRVSFALRDLGCVPAPSRDACFRLDHRRWVPDEAIAEQVLLARPSELVDLVTVRDREDPPADALERLRIGGAMLFSTPPSSPPDGMRPQGSHDRLFCKEDGPASSPATEPIDGDPVDTLAARRVQEELVSSHVRLARSLARRFGHRGAATDELEQVALLALVKAARRFDPDRQAAFATYAKATILGELKRYFRDKTWMVRVPRSLQERYLAVKQARDELGHELGSSPTPAQVAQRLGVSEELVLEASDAGNAYTPASLDVPTSDEDRPTDIPVTDPGFEQALDRQRLHDLLPQLDRREHLVLKRLFFDGWTQQQVADEIGVSQMQVSRLLSGTISRLRGLLVDA
jgi:RNA polymerase sigma-B factor